MEKQNIEKRSREALLAEKESLRNRMKQVDGSLAAMDAMEDCRKAKSLLHVQPGGFKKETVKPLIIDRIPRKKPRVMEDLQKKKMASDSEAKVVSPAKEPPLIHDKLVNNNTETQNAPRKAKVPGGEVTSNEAPPLLPATHSQEDGIPKRWCVHRQIESFLRLPKTKVNSESYGQQWTLNGNLQVVHDGSALTSSNFSHILNPRLPILVRDIPESIGMQLPESKSSPLPGEKRQLSKSLTIRDIAEYVGYETAVAVIDVESQQEMEDWTFADLVNYFEDEGRVKTVSRSGHNHTRRRRIRSCTKAVGQRLVLNQISYEFSHTPLAEQFKSPTFVRELDWIDHAWPKESRMYYPVVQKYCLTSAAGCYTDFHIDFGGTSVWYHVLEGRKEFCLILPTKDNKKKYEQWLSGDKQTQGFLADWIIDKNDVLRLTLKQHQTMIIPAGWIHAVYTPQDSLVFGGNFLHGMDIHEQLEVYTIEERMTGPEKFRFPFFKPLHFYAAGMYLRQFAQGQESNNEKKEWSLLEIEGLRHLVHSLKCWWADETVDETVDEGRETYTPATVRGAAEYVARKCRYCSVAEFLLALDKQVHRMWALSSQKLEKGPTTELVSKHKSQRKILAAEVNK